jgi:hypothetical protein
MLGGGMAFPYCNLTKLDEWAALKGTVLPTWYEDVRDKALKAEADSKARAKAKDEAEKQGKADAAHASATSASVE